MTRTSFACAALLFAFGCSSGGTGGTPGTAGASGSAGSDGQRGRDGQRGHRRAMPARPARAARSIRRAPPAARERARPAPRGRRAPRGRPAPPGRPARRGGAAPPARGGTASGLQHDRRRRDGRAADLHEQPRRLPVSVPGPVPPIEDRITNLLSLLTVPEKLGLMNEYQLPVDRLGIKAYTTFVEGVHGIGWSGDPATPATSDQHERPLPDRHAVPAGVRAGRVVGSGGAAHGRRDDRLRGARLERGEAAERAGPRRRPGRARAAGRPRTRPALGTHRGGLRRGSVPHRRAGERLHRRPARDGSRLPAGRLDAEALARQQQRDQPQHQLVEHRRSQPARVLRLSVRAGDPDRQGEGDDVGLQQARRHVERGVAAAQVAGHRRMGLRRHAVHGRVGPAGAGQRPDGLHEPARGDGGDHQGRDRAHSPGPGRRAPGGDDRVLGRHDHAWRTSTRPRARTCASAFAWATSIRRRACRTRASRARRRRGTRPSTRRARWTSRARRSCC